jgi:hypothetical protein
MMGAKKITGYLVVRANGAMRVVHRRPYLRFDEVAFPLAITIPALWGTIQNLGLDLVLPEPNEATILAGQAEMLEDVTEA